MTKKAAPTKPILCRVTRRDHAKDPPRTETFEVDITPEATLHQLLAAIARNPTPRGGIRVVAPAWDADCLEGSCGGCAIRAGGRAVLACATRIDEVEKRRGAIVLEPLGVFPVVRDLIVDHAVRDRDIDATSIPQPPIVPPRAKTTLTPHNEGGTDAKPDAKAPPTSSIAQWERMALGACIACGACLDACPEVRGDGGFVGAEAIVKNRRAHADPRTSPTDRGALDAALSRPGGISECGHAQNCIEVCPADVPIALALSDAARVATSRFLLGWLKR